MGAHCCNHDSPEAALRSRRYRRILWTALAVNLAMFAVEIGAGLKAGSVSLLADSLDFMGDAANYAISLWVLGMALSWRARAAQFKAASMLLFGIGVLGAALWHWWQGEVPSAPTMGVIGALALAANVGVAVLLYAYREGDSNMRSVWLCTRNDAVGNLAVLGAALGVFGTGSAWPDLIVASIMAALAITAAVQVLRQADGELKDGHGHAH
ncbi:cation transporter [Pseudomonas subflava]|uniref:cation transporter n=1 Tax=Pseudomonas subflava TaxID=2952933 RepID=UPI00207A7E2F|nr:cation transporter [Pseudomonas subflava]